MTEPATLADLPAIRALTAKPGRSIVEPERHPNSPLTRARPGGLVLA
jgi:hypothetical protein